MSPIDRRSFLRGAALGGAALATTGAASATGAGPEGAAGRPREYPVPPSTLPADPADCPVEHIGVLMMENRSFDTYLGWLPGSRGFLDLGLDLSYTDPATGETGSPTHWAPRYRRGGHPDPGHGWGASHDQYEHGFLVGDNDPYALAYYLPEDIQIFARLARQFTVMDGYHCSLLGPTYPNRHYQHSGTSNGFTSNDFPFEIGYPTGFDWPTIWDRLEAAGISWAYYFSDLPFAAMYGPRLLHRVKPITQYFVDAATGNLPQVFFVDPSFLPPFQTDDHPSGADIRSGQVFVNNVLHAFVNSSAWSSGMMLVNYDEHGGFFDHVTPPRVADGRATDDFRTDFGQLGFRVPNLVVSPYARRGFVHHGGPFEHSSVLRFVEWRFELEPLTVRTANAANLGEVLDHASAPRLDVVLDRLEAPSPSDVVGNYQDEFPPEDHLTDFQRFAASPWLERMGYQVGTPTLEQRFGVGAWLDAAVVAAGGVPTVGG